MGSKVGGKYHRRIRGIDGREAVVDVYCVLRSFAVTEPGAQHAIKKLLCAGLRDKGSAHQDLTEAIEAIEAAIRSEQLEELAEQTEQNERSQVEQLQEAVRDMLRTLKVISPGNANIACYDLPAFTGVEDETRSKSA